MGLKEDFNNLTPTKCLMAGFFICIIYYFLLFDKGEQQISEIQKAQAEVEDKEKRMEQVQKAMSNKAAFEQEVASLEKDFIELLKFFPVNLDMNGIQKDITLILSKGGAKLLSLKEASIASRFSGYIEHGVDIETQSDFHEIMMLLSEITKMNKVVDFRAMEFISENSNDEFSIIKFKMKFSIFSQDPTPASKIPPAGAPLAPGGKQ